jgi:hypothetical protein
MVIENDGDESLAHASFATDNGPLITINSAKILAFTGGMLLATIRPAFQTRTPRDAAYSSAARTWRIYGWSGMTATSKEC